MASSGRFHSACAGVGAFGTALAVAGLQGNGVVRSLAIAFTVGLIAFLMVSLGTKHD